MRRTKTSWIRFAVVVLATLALCRANGHGDNDLSDTAETVSIVLYRL